MVGDLEFVPLLQAFACIGVFAIVLVATFCVYTKVIQKRAKNTVTYTVQWDNYVDNFQCSTTKNDLVDNICEDTSTVVPQNMKIDSGTFTIQRNKILGQGIHGTVFSGLLVRNGSITTAAVKTADGPAENQILLSEIKILSYLGAHQNVLKLLGVYTKSFENGLPEQLYIFTELCSLGSLYNLLRSYMNKFITFGLVDPRAAYATYITTVNGAWTTDHENSITDNLSGIECDLKRWSYEIANGMEYLASTNVIHADLATRNVLITKTKQAKICDFSMSQRICNTKGYVETKDDNLPWRWMAPEALNRLIVNEKTDVWAFGVTLWEMFSFGATPYQGIPYSKTFVTCLINGSRLKTPMWNLDDIYTVMLECWNINPEGRPKFEEITSKLLQKFHVVY